MGELLQSTPHFPAPPSMSDTLEHHTPMMQQYP